MNTLQLIIMREYRSIVAKKSFLLMTLLLPLVIVLVGATPIIIAQYNSAATDTTTIAVLDQSGTLGNALTDTEGYHFVPLNPGQNPDPKHFLNSADGRVQAVVLIPKNVEQIPSVSIYAEKAASVNLKRHIDSCLTANISRQRLLATGIPNIEQIIAQSEVKLQIQNISWDKEGREQTSQAEVVMILGMVLAFVIYMFVLSYGAMIMNSVLEEKTNRIVEVIISSCKPTQLMMGKIIGVALAGLTQFAIWGAMATIVYIIAGSDQVQELYPQAGILISTLGHLPLGKMLGIFFIYFVGGYMLYASLFAAFGASVDQASDASQFSTPIVLVMMVALYAGIACAENPDGPIALVTSFIPFTSPIVMMVRVAYDVPWWQMLLSITLLYATTALLIAMAAKIYRTGILMYGKKHSFADMIKWLKL